MRSPRELCVWILACARLQEAVALLRMRAEIVDDSPDGEPAATFPRGEDYFDLRENPRAIERIAAARQNVPLRNFLAAVNGADSVFTSASARAQLHPPPPGSPGEGFSFSSQTRLVFAETSFNFERDRYAEIVARLKGLLERDSGEALRAILRISACQFTEQARQGYCLSIQLSAQGTSAEQAEMRWGLGLARLQQALLFSARAWRQQQRGA